MPKGGKSSPKGGAAPALFLNPIHGAPAVTVDDAQEELQSQISAVGSFVMTDDRSLKPPEPEPEPEPGSMRADAEASVLMKKYERIFQKYDADNSGEIDREELEMIMKEMGHNMSKGDLDSMMADLDRNQSGSLDFTDFMAAVQGQTSKTFDELNKSIEEKIFGSAREGERTIVDEGYADPNKCCGLIHPNSSSRAWYDIMQLLLLMYTLCMVPWQIAFAHEPGMDEFQFWLDFGVWLFFLMDLFIQMHTYYISGRTGQLVSDMTKVRARYFRTWFVVDFVAVFPVDYLLRALQWHNGAEANSFRMLRLARLLRYLRLLKLSNIKRLEGISRAYQRYVGWDAMTIDFVYKVMGMVFTMAAFNHLTGCMWLFIGRSYSQRIEPYPDPPVDAWWDDLYGPQIDRGEHPTHWAQYVDACYFVMMTLTSVGYGDITPINVDEKWFCYLMMYATAFFYAYVIGVFADVVATRRMDRNHFDAKMRSVFEFLHHVDAPDELLDQIKIFYSHRYPRKTLFNEDMIYEELPPKFSRRLVLHRFEDVVHHVPFFRSCTDECIVAICRKFHGFTATPDDIIIEKGEHNELIILEKGAATGTDGTVRTNYPSGSFFGEMEFLGLSEVSATTITANDYCDLYGLRFADIADTLMDFPDLQDKLHQYAQMRKQAMDQIKGVVSDKDEDDYQEPHHDAIAVSDQLKNSSRASLQAVLLAAVVSKQITVQELDG